MNKILSGLSLLCLILLGGCSQENFQVPGVQVNEGDEVTVRFSVLIPEFKTVQTRVNGGVNDMYLLVFDENGSFIVRRPAALHDQTETGGTFTASLPSSSSPRVVHFVSNLNPDAFNDSPGVNEATVVALLSTTNATFWSRVELNTGISSTSFDGITVELLRNQAKISVTNNASNFNYTGFTIHNASDKGTVAPYSVANGFAERTITEPAGVTLLPALLTSISPGEKYLFERKNATASDITTVIVQGTYEGQSYYYKIDLIDADKNRYDIERNWHYVVKIESVTRAGYSSFNDALAGASHNNTALDPVIEKYPIISDGISKLEVEKTLIILTQPDQTFQVWAKYFPNINSDEVNNEGVTVALQSGNEAIAGALLNFNPTTGIISGTGLSALPEEPGVALIRVSKGDLARTIRVQLRTPFSFNPGTINNANPGTVQNGQSQDAILRFYIPDDFPDDLFPLPVKIHTQGLYPASTGLEMVVEGGQVHYIYRATQKGQQTINFKTNKSNNTETVTLQADYFTDGTVAYQTDVITISGSIEYYERYWWGNSWSNVPRDASISVTEVTDASMQVPSNGNYTLTIPYTTENPTITFIYIRSNQTYRQAKSWNELRSSPSLRLDWIN